MEDKERVEIDSLEDWRFWLQENYDKKDGVWVVSWKKHCGDRYVDYDSIVGEALCYGWVDSHQRRVDDDRTKLYISPRKKGSPWSDTNKKRVKKLIEEDRMMSPGLAKIKEAKKDGSWSVYDDIEKCIEPVDLKQAFRKQPPARKHWDKFPRQVKKNLLWWIKSAKREETRKSRIEKVVDQASRGLMANHPNN